MPANALLSHLDFIPLIESGGEFPDDGILLIYGLLDPSLHDLLDHTAWHMGDKLLQTSKLTT